MEKILSDMTMEELLGDKNLLNDNLLNPSALNGKFLILFSMEEIHTGVSQMYIGVFKDRNDYLKWCQSSLYPFMSLGLEEQLKFEYNAEDALEKIFQTIESHLNNGKLNFDYNILAYGSTHLVLESLLNGPNGDFI